VSGTEDEEGMTKSANAIKALMDAEIDGSAEGLNGKGIQSNRIVVGGFSQGGAMALLSGFTKSPAIGGIMALSCWLPLRAKLVAPLFPDHATTLPVFMAHGTADPVVKYSYGERSSKFIRAGDGGGAGLGLGAFRKAEDGQKWRGIWFESYPGLPHSACPEEVN
jgi:predicted esterase